MAHEPTETGNSAGNSSDSKGARVYVAGYRTPAPSWPQFLQEHGDWYRDRVAEAEVVYAFPAKMTDHRLVAMFGKIGEREINAEREYAAICESVRAVAILHDRWIPYRWLEPTLPRPVLNKAKSDKLKQLGWTDDDIRFPNSVVEMANSVDERLMGSIGRLVCSPKFVAARDSLPAQWEALPPSERPAIPLRRSLKEVHPEDALDGVAASPRQTGFANAFDRFCDAWRLLGMATWDLPEIDGPKWPEPELGAPTDKLGRVPCDTPWHFFLREDDNVGDLLREQHAQASQKMSIDDHKSWKTYAHLFLIDFWERMIRSRYAGMRRPRGFVTALTSFIADIVRLDSDRVTKLRKDRSSLQRGSLTSLAGRH